jgi:hypothetical protein
MSQLTAQMPRLTGLVLAIGAAAGALWVHGVRSDTSPKSSGEQVVGATAQPGKTRPVGSTSGAGRNRASVGRKSAPPSLAPSTSPPAHAAGPVLQAVVAPGVPTPTSGSSPGEPAGPVAKRPARRGPLARGPKHPDPVAKGPRRPGPVSPPSVPPAPAPPPPKPEPVAAPPPAPVQSPASEPAAAAADPDAAQDDTGLGTLDTSNLGSPVDETAPP